MNKKLFGNILIYDISYKTLIGTKPLHIRFDKIDEFIKIYDGTRYLVLFIPEKYNAIYNKIRYLISQKNGITYVISRNYVKIKVDSYDSLPVEETLTFHNIIIYIKSVWDKDKDQNHYYYDTFLEKYSNQFPMTYKCYIIAELTFLQELMKRSESKEHDLCHYWYFIDKWFKFQ